MTTATIKGSRLGSTRLSAETRAEITIRVSKEIVRTEAEIRKAKTARLKAARMEMLAREPEPASAKGRAADDSKHSGS